MTTAAEDLYVLQHLPRIRLAPGMAIFLTVIAVNFFGDGLRDALDPHTRNALTSSVVWAEGENNVAL